MALDTIDLVKVSSDGLLIAIFIIVLRSWFTSKKTMDDKLHDTNMRLSLIEKDVCYIKKAVDSISETKIKED